MTAVVILFFIFCPIVGFFIYKELRRNTKGIVLIGEFAFISAFVISTALFCLVWVFNFDDYYTNIDIVDG
ncbi:MAG: hypothetical protein EOP00_27415, partial [Pedobacter sp.]